MYMRIATAMSRLRESTDLSEYLLLSNVICTKSHVLANMSFQQCGIMTSVDSDEPAYPLFKLRHSKLCSVSGLSVIEYSCD